MRDENEEDAKITKQERWVDAKNDEFEKATLAASQASSRVAVAAADGFLLADDAQPSQSDLFDVSLGTQVTATSGDAGGVTHMFGDPSGGPDEGQNTIFTDGEDAGYTHWVEWKTNGVVTLTSVVLFAVHDDILDGFYEFRRAFSNFKLFYKKDNAWSSIPLVNYGPALPYGGNRKAIGGGEDRRWARSYTKSG